MQRENKAARDDGLELPHPSAGLASDGGLARASMQRENKAARDDGLELPHQMKHLSQT